MGFSYNVNVLNQKGSPAIYTDTFANRPAFGFAGRLFIANDTAAIYEDTGTSWVLIANVSSGAGTLQQVTTNGNTSNVGISVTAGGVSTNSATITSLTQGSVPFVGAAGLITQDNTNLFFDDTNNRLGINTNTPSNNLDVHGSGTTALIALNNTAGNQSLIAFAKNSTAKWRIGNSSTDTFDVINVGTGTNAISIDSTTNLVSLIAALTAAGKIISQANGSTFGTSANGLIPVIIQSNVTGSAIQLINTSAGTARILVSGTASSSNIGFNTFSTNDAFVITNNGFIGIGTATPSTTLDVVGSGVFSGSVTANNGTFTSTVGIGNPSSVEGVLTIKGTSAQPPTSGTTANSLLQLIGSLGNQLNIGSNTIAGDYGSYIQSSDNNLAINYPLNLQPNGGNVRINTSTDLNARGNSLLVNGPETCQLFGYGNGFGIGLFMCPNSAATGTHTAVSFRSPANVEVGSITTTSSATLYNTISDYRIKNDFKDFNAILLLNNIKIYDFEFLADNSRMFGVIAHELQEILPYLVNGEKDALDKDGNFKLQSVDYSKIVPILIKATQEQQKQIDNQNTLIQSLINRIELLENK